MSVQIKYMTHSLDLEELTLEDLGPEALPACDWGGGPGATGELALFAATHFSPVAPPG